MTDERSGFVFIGAGAVGTALAILLRDEGMQIRAVASRREASARRAAAILGGAEVVSSAVEAARLGTDIFITTPESAIGPLAQQLAEAEAVGPGCRVIHMSGALGLEPLEPVRRLGAFVGGFHPLQAFATWERGRELIPGSAIGVESLDEETRTYLFGLAARIGAHAVTIPHGSRALYHAGAVSASNYVVAALSTAMDLLEEAGIPRRHGQSMLLPLVRGAIETIPAEGSVEKALTGPVVRGDIEVVEAHLAAIEDSRPEILPFYRVLGRRALELARMRRTLTKDQDRKLDTLLD